jgi:hypothetical protein
MPTTARRATTTATPTAVGPPAAKAPRTGGGTTEGTTTLAETREEAASSPAGTGRVGSPSTSAGGDVTTTLAEAREEAAGPAGAGSAAASSLRQAIFAPVTVAREVADDVASTLRRPDAVLYIGGVTALAVLGIVEWPVAAVAGVGLAIANGRRRGRG